MELKIKTTELQEMVSKAINCSSNNKLIPLTSLMSIKVKDNILTITTTDATNYLSVSKEEKVACDDFEFCVVAELFTKLVQKTTSPEIVLDIEGAILKVKGNGTYTMELPLDENGGVIKYPSKYDIADFTEDLGVVKLSTIKSILNYNKPSLSTSIEIPSLTCYYCGDKVISTDRFKICSTDISVFKEAKLISSQLMEVLGVLTNENISVLSNNSSLVFKAGNDVVYAPITEGIETFPVSAIDGLISSAFTSHCTVSRTAVMSVVDRLSLFVSPYDKRGIYLTFTKDGILFSSKKSSGTELIPFISSDDFADYTCCVDIEMLKSQISTQSEDVLDISYGSDIAIKLVNKNITQIISLMEDERVEE